MIWFFLWSILTAFTTQQECESFRGALVSHAQSVHGSSATICQGRP